MKIEFYMISHNHRRKSKRIQSELYKKLEIEQNSAKIGKKAGMNCYGNKIYCYKVG